MQLIEDHAVSIEAVLIRHIRREHLIKAAGRLIDDALFGVEDFHPLRERRAHADHIGGDIENDGRLIVIGGAAVDLGAFFTVAAGEQQRNGGGKFRLAHLLRNFHIGGVELTVAVGL